MFKQIFFFELKLWFKKPATYIFFVIFILLSMLLTAAIAGILGGVTSDNNTVINSAGAIAGVLSYLSTNFMGLIIIVIIIGPAVYKDFQYNVYPLLFTQPISKSGYLFGRFGAAFLVALFVLSGTILGHMLICALPAVDPGKLGPLRLINYLEPFFLFVVPNTLLVGAILFSLVTFSRNMLAGYVGCIVLLLIKGIASSILGDLDNQNTASILEPFGEQAFYNITRYWSPAEQNTLLIPFEGVLVYNRLLWLGIGIGITVITFFQFKFGQFASPISVFGRKKNGGATSFVSMPVILLSDIPKATQTFSSKFNFYQAWFLVKFEFVKIVKSIFFIIIVILSVLSFVLIFSQNNGKIYGTPTYPITYNILEIAGIISGSFILILIVFYSGILVWRERDARVDELIGSSPLAPWVGFTSKLTALILVQTLLLFVMMVTGIIIQLHEGYYKIEIMQYIETLFGFKLITLSITCVMAMAIQVIVNNKYTGMFVTIVILILIPYAFDKLEWNNILYRFNSNGPQLPYSDMNGFGHTIFPFIVLKTYWGSFAAILAVISSLFWVRGKEKSFKNRLSIAKHLFVGKAKLALKLSFLVFLVCGGFIYYNTHLLNQYNTPKEEEEKAAAFEKKYKKYSKTPQPRIVSVNMNVDIYPDELGVKMNGYYILKNKTTKQIDSLVLNINEKAKIIDLNFDMSAKVVLEDKENGFYIYKLQTPLNPGDSIKFNINLGYFKKGFSNSNADGDIVYNGTFINSLLLPNLGYSEGIELSDNSARKKYGLNTKEEMANVNDSLARMNNYISNDADWINFECVVSTSNDQIAIAPGYLQKEWEQDRRKYFHYKMDCKILNFYSFLSAHYEVKRDKWKDVAIEIYYNKGHEYNLDRMIKGIKKSLDYYTKNFGPYQHRQVRILEFPRYSSFAQSFPNTIPFSESIGFMAKVDETDPESIDYPFYVTAHEVAHQWWAHQVIGGNVQGSAVMMETMAQYSALMVMEKEYGKAAMKKFLKYEMDHYLQGRAGESKKERSLMLCENQPYIHYNKGSVVMYALKDYLVEDSLNSILARYIKKTAYQEPPYTNSLELVNSLKNATPDSLKHIITDMFESITLFENKVAKCSYSKTKEGKYLVSLAVSSKKMKADSIGNLKDVAINDWVDIAIFGSKKVEGKEIETILYMQKKKIDKNKMDFSILVDEEPIKAGIDPSNKLIDRKPDNNTKFFKGADKEDEGDGQEGSVSITIGV